jgi:hypothetical protein
MITIFAKRCDSEHPILLDKPTTFQWSDPEQLPPAGHAVRTHSFRIPKGSVFCESEMVHGLEP